MGSQPPSTTGSQPVTGTARHSLNNLSNNDVNYEFASVGFASAEQPGSSCKQR